MLTTEVQQILQKRFPGDSLIALATVSEGQPEVRAVDAYYEDGSFYIITHALSGKMRQLEKNPTAAIAADWFTAKGEGENLGWFGLEKNRPMAQKLRAVFSSWIDNGHNNFEDENTVILRVRLTSGVLFADGKRYEVDFSEK